MAKTRLSTKGQIVLPRAIREARKWQPGTEFRVVETEEGILLSPVEPAVRGGSVETLVGCLRYEGRTISIEEMEQAIEVEARRRT